MSSNRERRLNKNHSEKRPEDPSTPGRPIFRFRRSFPSKWDDAEKWLNHESIKSSDPPIAIKQEKSEDKYTYNTEPFFTNFQYSAPVREGFVFNNSYIESMKEEEETEMVAEVQRRDMGTEMTPAASLSNTRSHTPVKELSPARHNTPASRSGLLESPSVVISELKDCHFAKMRLSDHYDSKFANWSTREEEEEEVSKSLRLSEVVGEKTRVAESRAASWEDDERSKSCIRYQREEAKVQAWLNLEKAKAEAQSKKLEVKIEKMRSNLEGKLMKRMALVNKRAEEMRGAARLQHTQQIVKATEQAQKMRNQQSQFICGCFPVNNNQL